MSDFFRLIKRMGVWRKYIFLLILRSPFDAFRTWMMAGLIKNVFLCVEIRDTGRLAAVCLIYGLALRHMPGLKENVQKAMAESTSAIKPLITEADTILLYDVGGLMMKKCEESSRRLMKINQSMHMRNALSSAFLRLFGASGYLVANHLPEQHKGKFGLCEKDERCIRGRE